MLSAAFAGVVAFLVVGFGFWLTYHRISQLGGPADDRQRGAPS